MRFEEKMKKAFRSVMRSETETAERSVSTCTAAAVRTSISYDTIMSSPHTSSFFFSIYSLTHTCITMCVSCTVYLKQSSYSTQLLWHRCICLQAVEKVLSILNTHSSVVTAAAVVVLVADSSKICHRSMFSRIVRHVPPTRYENKMKNCSKQRRHDRLFCKASSSLSRWYVWSPWCWTVYTRCITLTCRYFIWYTW